MHPNNTFQDSRQLSISPVVKILLISNVAMHFLGPQLGYIHAMLALWPVDSGYFMPWQLLTYGFLHGGFGHLFFNMYALWMFGSVIEKTWGSKPFTFYYFVCVVGAAIVQSVVSLGSSVPTVGASGGLFGVLLAYGWMFPNAPIYFMFIPAPIKAKYFVLIYGAIELFLGVTSLSTGIAHFAHLGGMLFGYLLILYWLGKLPFKPKRFLQFR